MDGSFVRPIIFSPNKGEIKKKQQPRDENSLVSNKEEKDFDLNRAHIYIYIYIYNTRTRIYACIRRYVNTFSARQRHSRSRADKKTSRRWENPLAD